MTPSCVIMTTCGGGAGRRRVSVLRFRGYCRSTLRCMSTPVSVLVLAVVIAAGALPSSLAAQARRAPDTPRPHDVCVRPPTPSLAPAPDLYCIDLVPTPDLAAAAGA